MHEVQKSKVSSASTVEVSVQRISPRQPLRRKPRKVCASEGSSRLMLTSTILLTWAPWECCCSRQKPHHWLRQCTYHHVRNSWMWQEYHVPHNWKGSDFSAAREWLNSPCYSIMGAYKLHGQGLKKELPDDDSPNPFHAICFHHPCSAHQAVNTQ